MTVIEESPYGRSDRLGVVLNRYGSWDIEWLWKTTVMNPMPQSGEANVKLRIYRDAEECSSPWIFWNGVLDNLLSCINTLAGDEGWYATEPDIRLHESVAEAEFTVSVHEGSK